MKTETLFTLKKLIEKRCEKEKLEPGEYEINETVILNVIGGLKKGNSYDRTPTVSIPLKTALILCLDKLDFFKLRNFKEILTECMREALKEDENPTPLLLEKVVKIERAEKHLVSTLEKLPKVTCSGPTTVDAEMIEVPIEDLRQPKTVFKRKRVSPSRR